MGPTAPPQRYASLVRRGLSWLADNQNDDGGWGDTVESPSNISATTLCWAAIGAIKQRTKNDDVAVQRAEVWLSRKVDTTGLFPHSRGSDEGGVGRLSSLRLAEAVSRVYGKDRTFAAPILTMCALAGRFGSGPEGWRTVPTLPFELAVCPHRWFRWLSCRGLPRRCRWSFAGCS